MPVNLRNRSFVKELDFDADELRYLIRLAAELKDAARSEAERQYLAGRKIALVFEKPSIQTRCAFEVAAYDQGAHVTYLGPDSAQMGRMESVRDTARVLGRMYDAIEYQGCDQEVVEEMARYAGVPVYNGLSDQFNPTQMLADMLTMREHSPRPLNEIAYCYVGDARFSTGNSLMIMGAKLGMDVRICGPRSLWPDSDLVDASHRLAKESGARLLVTDDVRAAVWQADYLYTDVWVSTADDISAWGDSIEMLMPYQVSMEMMELTGNPEVEFMHHLPALHDRDTKVGEHVYQEFGFDALEVTDEIFQAPYSLVFDQAENRMHTIKAVLVATLGPPPPP